MLRIARITLVVSLIAVSLSAQEASPFHGGQWGMQFGGGANLFDLGVLHFTSARSAWLLDLSTFSTIIDATSTSLGTSRSADQQQLGIAVRVGKRAYRIRRASVVSFHTISLESGWSDALFNGSFGMSRFTQWNAGLNGELGAAYMLTPDLSLGGTADLSAGYVSYKRSDPGPTTEKGNGFYHQYRVRLALGLYF